MPLKSNKHVRSAGPGAPLDSAAKPKDNQKRGSSSIQAAKGEVLREQVLEAAVSCLATMPYSDVSAGLVAKRAGVSRGGMQYHFPTLLSLLQGCVAFLHKRRLAIFRSDLLAKPPIVDAIDHMIDAHWRHLNEREFAAYQELVLAGRSQPELASMLASSYRTFLDEWHEIARSILGWEYQDPQVARSGNIAHYLMEGMAYGRLGGQLTDDEVDELLDYTKDILRRHL